MKHSGFAVAAGFAALVSASSPTSVWTLDAAVTSVEYSTKLTSTYCPSAGVYPHPYKHGQLIEVNAPTWTTVQVPYTTIYVWPTGTADKKDATEAVYQDLHVIKVEMVTVHEMSKDGKTWYSAGEVQESKPTWTPPSGPYPDAPSKTASSLGPKKTLYVELVAQNGVVRYIPDRVDAAVGDVINFNFRAAAHSVTQSTFDTPCTRLEGGFDSDLIPNPNNLDGDEFTRQFTVETADKPLWFYCKQQNANHCGQGMVFGINPGDKMDQFIENAKRQNGALVTRPTATPTAAPADAESPSMPAASPTYTVTVSGGFKPDGSNDLKYDPPFLNGIEKGTKILFDFLRANHTLTESSFDSPCEKKADTKIDTNFENVNTENIPLLVPEIIEIDTDVNVPRYFYCKQANRTPTGHCSNGMVFAVNIDEARFLEFQQRAKDTLVPAAMKQRFARMFKV